MIGPHDVITEKEMADFETARANGREFSLEAATLTASLLERQYIFDGGVLDLSQKYLRDEHVQILAQGLRHNRSITKLDLSRLPENPELLNVPRSFGDRGVIEIAKALQANRALTTLDLRWIKITEVAYRALAEGLENNSVLTELKFTAPKITMSGDHLPFVEKIHRAHSRLENNLRCLKFYFPHRLPSIEEVERVRDLVKRNRRNHRLMTVSLLSYLLEGSEERTPEKCSLQ